MKKIAYWLGFDWIANQTLRKVVRIVANVGLTLAAATPAGAPILAVLNIVPSPEAGAIVGAGLALIEAVRNSAKHSDDEK